MGLGNFISKTRSKLMKTREERLYSDTNHAKAVFKEFARKFYFEYDTSYAHYFSVLGITPTDNKTQ